MSLYALLGASSAAAQSATAHSTPSPWALSEAIGAPDGLTLSASSRLRLETIDGQPKPGFNDSDTVISLRTSLFAEYRTGAVRIGGEMIDSRVWNADRLSPVSANDVNALEPVQGYVAVDLAPLGKGSKATLKAGRFVLNLGSRRLVAADDYHNTTNGYTGVHADIVPGAGWRANLLYVLPQTRLPADPASVLDAKPALDRESFDAILWGGLVTRAKAIGPVSVEAGFFHFGERDRAGLPTRDRSLNTAGGRVFREPAPGKADFEIEAYGQWGRSSTGTAATAPTLPVSAWMLHADAGHSLAGKWKPRVSLRFDYVSGDRAGGRYTRFDTLFGMRRAELAPAGLYNAVGRANLVSPGIRFEAAPGRRSDGFLAYRALWLASATDSFSTTGVRDASGRAGRFAGHQLEGRVRQWLVPNALRLEANALYLAKGRFLERAPNAPRYGDTLYTSLNLTAYF